MHTPEESGVKVLKVTLATLVKLCDLQTGASIHVWYLSETQFCKKKKSAGINFSIILFHTAKLFIKL
jgi:hypothetical protein